MNLRVKHVRYFPGVAVPHPQGCRLKINLAIGRGRMIDFGQQCDIAIEPELIVHFPSHLLWLFTLTHKIQMFLFGDLTGIGGQSISLQSNWEHKFVRRIEK